MSPLVILLVSVGAGLAVAFAAIWVAGRIGLAMKRRTVRRAAAMARHAAGKGRATADDTAWADVERVFADAPKPPLTPAQREAEWKLVESEFSETEKRRLRRIIRQSGVRS